MPKVVIADTSCLIVLSNIEQLKILRQLYGNIVTTPDVEREYGETLPDWVEINYPKDKTRQVLLELQLDKGESSAIALALEIPDSILIIDDYKARKIAEQLQLKITGTLGILIKAKQRGFLKSIMPIVKKLKSSGFRISDDLENDIKILSDE